MISKKQRLSTVEITRSSDRPQPTMQAVKKLGPIKRYAIWLLSRQDYSAADLERRFKLKGYPAAEIEDCMRFLKEHTFQSDERFAGARARSKSGRQGNTRIAMELKTKGVAPELIAKAVNALGSEEDRAIDVARKFAGKEMTQALKAKAWRFLMSRGFGSNAIKSAMASLGAAHGDG